MLSTPSSPTRRSPKQPEVCATAQSKMENLDLSVENRNIVLHTVGEVKLRLDNRQLVKGFMLRNPNSGTEYIIMERETGWFLLKNGQPHKRYDMGIVCGRGQHHLRVGWIGQSWVERGERVERMGIVENRDLDGAEALLELRYGGGGQDD